VEQRVRSAKMKRREKIIRQLRLGAMGPGAAYSFLAFQHVMPHWSVPKSSDPPRMPPKILPGGRVQILKGEHNLGDPNAFLPM